MEETPADIRPDRPNNWGRWGDDDERGALNLLDASTTLGARDSITAGAVYSLGIPVQSYDVPLADYRGKPMRLTLQDATDEGGYPAEYGCAPGTGAHEDVMIMASHTTTHMDALIHVYGEYRHYNGVDFRAMRAMAGATKLGIDKVGGFAARAVLLDMVGHFGDEPEWIRTDRTLTAADLRAAAERQGTPICAGDVVLIRTGYLQYWLQRRPDPSVMAQPGIGLDAAAWLAAQDVVAVGSDNMAVETLPFDAGEFLGCHKILLVDHGIYLIELLDLVWPARDGHYEGLIIVAPLKVTGATGCPVNPIFIA